MRPTVYLNIHNNQKINVIQKLKLVTTAFCTASGTLLHDQYAGICE